MRTIKNLADFPGTVEHNEDGTHSDVTADSVIVEGLVRSYDLDVIGVEWDQSTDSWRHIDLEGNTITPSSSYFDNHQVWGNIRPVNLAPDGEINYVRGDASFAWDGTQGRVMVEIPKFFVKKEKAEGPKYRWWISPIDRVGFEIHPAFLQSGSTTQRTKDFLYVGAKEADLEYDGSAEAYDSSHEKLHSRTGFQPITGGQIWRVDFDAGGNEPAIGNDVSTPNDANWFVVDYLVESGAWANYNATGKIWVRKPGDDALGWNDNDLITNNTAGNTIGICEYTGGDETPIPLTIADARTFANNIGTDWHQMGIWSMAAIQLLYYVEYADPDCQTTIGPGITELPSGTGFAGKLIGVDNLDTNVAANGTGTGDGGTADETPIAYRWIENPWGNVWKFLDGYNADDASYQVLNREGTNVPKDNMDDAQTPLSSSTAPIQADGFIDDILWDNGFELLFFASSVGGASSSHLYDFWFGHDSGETNVLTAGGAWGDGVIAGIDCRLADRVTSTSIPNFGARLEFRR